MDMTTKIHLDNLKSLLSINQEMLRNALEEVKTLYGKDKIKKYNKISQLTNEINRIEKEIKELENETISNGRN